MKKTFESLIQDRHNNLRNLKQQGRKIVGYFCSYCPEEIVYAAGLVPVRVLGGEGLYSSSSNYLYSCYCSYSHGCLNEGLKGDTDYLAGIVYAYACEHTRGVFDSWRMHIPTKYAGFLDMPGWVNTSEAVKFYTEELKGFKKGLEGALGVKVTEESLVKAIELCNHSRSLLREIYQLKKSSPPVVSGAEVFSMVLSSTVYPKDEHNKLLTRTLAGLKRRKNRVGGKRLMVLGADLHYPGIIAAIEGQGAVVVADELCTGSRYIWEDVKLGGDPWEAIARRYLGGINCPVKHPMEGRLSHIEKMLQEFAVEGVLLLDNDKCDPVEWAEPLIKQMLQKKNIPWSSVEIAGIAVKEDIPKVAEATRKLIGG